MFNEHYVWWRKSCFFSVSKGSIGKKFKKFYKMIQRRGIYVCCDKKNVTTHQPRNLTI